MRSDPLHAEDLDELDELDEADLEEAPVSPIRHETPPPPPLPTKRDLTEPEAADPDLSDVFAAISPKKAKEKVPLPPGVKERKRAMLVTSPIPRRAEPARTRRLQEPGESTVAIPPPPRVPTIAGPALPPPPAMTPGPVSVRVRPQYSSSLSAIAVDRAGHQRIRSMSVPPAYGMPSTTPWTAIAFAAAVVVLAITGGGFAFGFSRAAARSESSATTDAQPREYDTAAVTSLDTTSASDKAEEKDQPAAPRTIAFGTLRFADPPAGALVDGAPRKISGGALVLTCGPHRIKRPGHATQVVSVPCNGATTL